MDIHLFVEPDEDFEGFITFSTWWDQNRTWRERFRVCWMILRGKSHYFDSISLDKDDAQKIQDYLALHLQRTIHVDFTTSTTTS